MTAEEIKQPWQMTRKELYELAKPEEQFMRRWANVQRQKGRGGAFVMPPECSIQNLTNYKNHSRIVKDALEMGKPVPPEVLADYPNWGELK